MPNGGTHHCAKHCSYFDNTRLICRLRDVPIESPYWTTCRNFNEPGSTLVGPLFAIVCEVNNGSGSYCVVPYFDGRRVEAVQREGRGNTIVSFIDRDGHEHEFPTVSDYMEFFWESGRNAALMSLQISRSAAKTLGEETVAILQAGYYTAPSGKRVNIQHDMERAVRDTVSYPPESNLPTSMPSRGTTTVEIRNETTLSAAEYLRGKNFAPVALNLASATIPGGGFLSGARAQEEYLARSTALWACLRNNPMYAYHQLLQTPFYSDYVVYSPHVPVIRDDGGELLEAPYPCSVITSPAVFATEVYRRMHARTKEISSVMWNRILKVLAVAARHEQRALVLGAWGCGAFGNNPREIAKLFRHALMENYKGVFEHVVFAIADWSDDEKFIGPFVQEFGCEKKQTKPKT